MISWTNQLSEAIYKENHNSSLLINVGLQLNQWKELSPDLVDNKTVIPDAHEVKDSNGSFDVDTTLIPVDHIVSINNLLYLSLSSEHLRTYLVSDPLIQSWVVIDADGDGG